MNNSVFGKTMEIVRKHRHIKLEPNYHTTKWFSKNLIATEMQKIKVKMNKPIYLGFLTLDLSKIVMYEFWYDYVKPKYGKKAKICYMDTDSFIIYIKTEDFHKDIADDVEKIFDTSNYIEDLQETIKKLLVL